MEGRKGVGRGVGNRALGMNASEVRASGKHTATPITQSFGDSEFHISLACAPQMAQMP